jgi:acetyl esterase/lipase
MSISAQAAQINAFLRANAKSYASGDVTVEGIRAQVGAMSSMQAPLPDDVQVEHITLDGIPAEQLSTPASRSHAAILYFHGGLWMAGAPQSVRPMTWRLAKSTGIPVYALDYRLAPEYPYPAGLDDCIQAYHALLARGIPASSIVVTGDSAGGNLLLALALHLKAVNKPLPAALVGISSMTDLAYSGASFNTNAESDVMFTQKVLKWVAEVYTSQTELTNPFLSPLYGDLAGLPPTYLLTSSSEMLRDDSTRIAEKMQKAGVAVTLDIWPELCHDWPQLADQMPEGEQALEKVAAFITNKVSYLD